MSDDLKQRLDRLGDRVPGQLDAFERLVRVRDRKVRNRRRGALVLGLSVALVGSLVAVTTLRDGTTRIPRGSETPNVPVAWQPPAVLTVWPETPMDEGVAGQVQAQADAGDPDVQWRLDPEHVAERFGLEFLAWSSADAHDIDIDAPSGTATATLTPCPQAEACRPIGELRLDLRQPAHVGTGGIWSVAAVSSDPLIIDIPAADPAVALTSGSSIGIDVELQPDAATSAHIGFTAENGCSGAGSGSQALASGHHELTLPDAGPHTASCGAIGAGYVFVFVTDDTTIPVSDPLVESTAIEFPWLTVVPFFLEMEDPDATATATVSPPPAGSWPPRLTCEGQQTDVVLDADALDVEGDPTDEMAEFADQVFVQEGLGRGAQPLEGASSRDERVFVLMIGDEQIIAAVYFERSGGLWFPGAYSSCSDVG